MNIGRESFEIHRGDGSEMSLRTVVNAYASESRALRKAAKYRAEGLRVCVFKFASTETVEKIDG
jgi:hypothetical protein